jgi:hypothetical protein
MPTWLAIAIPSVVAVAAILMWSLDYSKKAHEIQKLRLELERLKRESERSAQEDAFRRSGLYRPTVEEVRIWERGIGGIAAEKMPPMPVGEALNEEIERIARGGSRRTFRISWLRRRFTLHIDPAK